MTQHYVFQTKTLPHLLLYYLVDNFTEHFNVSKFELVNYKLFYY